MEFYSMPIEGIVGSKFSLMHAYFLLLASFLPMALPAQFVSPYDPAAHMRNWSIKGKALPFVLGDQSGVSALLGIEYGISRNQSIGIDGFIESTSKSDENSIDTAGVMHSVSQYYHGTEKALFFNYRYYFNCRKLRDRHGIVPYALAFLRCGKIHQHYDPLYPLTSFLTNDETHYSAGLMAGSIFQLSHNGKLGVDVNMGIFVKQKDISTIYLKDNRPYSVTGRPISPGFRLSVNLLYWWYIQPAHHTPANS